ncbi:MAG: hypothetical protein IJ427_08410 [Lachnospiraceae bacterium]|nr:hypothetical protein [Lachnospiraceae bacterium]MBQ8548508.1 hypothetical protein [Lachnospiraceae bacterium]
MSENGYTPLLPFDSTVAENFVIYYPVPYVRDVNLIPPEKIAMESGNVVKYYRYQITEPVAIGGK